MLETGAAIEAALRAGEIILDGLNRADIAVYQKGPIDFATQIDRSAEAAIKSCLGAAFPGYGVLAEESGSAPGTSEGLWIIDPLDGTINFMKGYPFFSVSIGLQKSGMMVLGVVYNPVLRELYVAERGAGARLNGRPIHATAVANLGEAMLASGFPYDAWENPDNNSAPWAALLRRCLSLRRDGSAALDLCYVACGRLDGYWEKGLSPWDVAAGSLIAAEAEARVTDYSGEQGFLDSGEIVAANAPLHAELISTLATAR